MIDFKHQQRHYTHTKDIFPTAALHRSSDRGVVMRQWVSLAVSKKRDYFCRKRAEIALPVMTFSKQRGQQPALLPLMTEEDNSPSSHVQIYTPHGTYPHCCPKAHRHDGGDAGTAVSASGLALCSTLNKGRITLNLHWKRAQELDKQQMGVNREAKKNQHSNTNTNMH